MTLLYLPSVSAQVTSFKFDFGNGKTAKGYKQVISEMQYTAERGYGFLPGASLKASDHRGKDPLTTDFISSEKPFFFSVRVPEGNYNVTVTMGDEKGSSVQTIRVENRRLMVENTLTRNGKITKKTFTVHVRTPDIAGSGERVRLKPRESGYFHWDDQLTIEFNGKEPKICGVEIERTDKSVSVFLAGNSTVVDQADEPYAAWGQMIPVFFQPGKVVIANYAESGETLKAFRAERRLAKILSLIKAGDYLFIEFVHNDQKPGGNHLDPFTTYKETINEYIQAARQKGAFPVLITSMHRRNFDENGKIINTLGDYPEAMRQLGKQENVPVIDLNAMSKQLYEAWGPEASLKAFVHFPANTFPGQIQKLEDNTHFTPYGAYELAKCMVEGIKKEVPGLAKYLRSTSTFNPSMPDPVDQWDWPLSPKVSVAKPDGN
ncbi:rhamnogalacturonan acetylesterase [Arcticibacter tournemirensis]|uniref:Rhamnogalacturonan acetylesterase n=2 Tax=Arcticibacter tournemirensis TaxID=699437 RepID=A0A5M9HKQ9_9SPHI|nr:rhamnogalacturonan acetylesterase [Arcticibacter tournemirensis]